MSKNRRALGRGLGALIPTASETPTTTPGSLTIPPRPSDMFFENTTSERPLDEAHSPTEQAPTSERTPDEPPLTEVPGVYLVDLPVEQIRANARQPRTVFDDDALAELTYSIREFGVLQPVVVRPTGSGFELVMGERRLRAAVAAGLATIPAIVRDTADDAMLRDALLENIHRAQLNPLEEAAAYQQLLEEFGVTHEQLAVRIGRSRSQVSNTVRLMNLSVPVQRRVAAGVLSAGHARALLSLDDADAQDEMAARIVAEGLSVRATEELVSVAARPTSLPRRRPLRRFTAPAAAHLAERLSDVLDTRVKVDIGQRKGRITVEFATIDDLERIVAVIAPQLTPAQISEDQNGRVNGRLDEDGHLDENGLLDADAQPDAHTAPAESALDAVR